MTAPGRKIIQYLEDARATERALQVALERQLEVAPRGEYQRDLVRHLRETREHVHRIRTRLERLGVGGISIRRFVVGAFGEAFSLAKAPFGLLTAPLGLIRQSPPKGPEEVLTRAKDACAIEARGIATYTAIERLAKRAGDQETAELASWIRSDEERMLERLRAHLPRLTDAVVASEVTVDAHHATFAPG